MKNYIGLQDDRHRLIDHDHHLNQKVADLQYIIQPQFIAADAIIAGQGRMLTPLPYDLKLIIMGNNQVAFDAVCCQIIGIDPLSVEHIRWHMSAGSGLSTSHKSISPATFHWTKPGKGAGVLKKALFGWRTISGIPISKPTPAI